MSKQSFRVESGLAELADQGALRTLTSGHWRQRHQVHILGHAWQSTVLARVPVVLDEKLDAQRLLGRVAIVGQDARPQYVEAVTAPSLDDVLGQVVQRFGEGIRVWMVEDRQNLVAPVPHRREQRLELRLDAGRYRGGEVVEGLGSLGLGQVEEAVERLLCPVGGRNVRLVAQPSISRMSLTPGF